MPNEFRRSHTAARHGSWWAEPFVRRGEQRVEDRIGEDVRARLSDLGHVVQVLPALTPATACICAVRQTDAGTLEGGADPRLESYALGW